MQIPTSLLALTATLTFAVADPSFRFSEYGNGDTTCSPDNLISPSVSIDDGFGGCKQFPANTNSVQYALLEGSRAGCIVKLFTNNACNESADSEHVPAVGETKCQPPIGGGWQSVQVTCP
ncbi:Ecp4 [Fulvia fulva]|uniref:Ecp4 n=1 Tax=Passalora fulva TaxID=5499 RepID=Q9P408_PASFU|nr:Ecp4 [Fulvia fulva]ABM47072.1 extracellular protein 4 [Fulvia fulva]KAK4634203.1 Ecp4 [Fulvia fulva]QDX18274.1 ECP4 protein [Fulvia fulva]UJO12859.1 Ecp4 [Fulvia fulva]WPV09750.1 Ecp4 [Fulvia fulva]